VIDIMRTHPMVIIGGMLQRNPFFLPSEQLLPELRERRETRHMKRPPVVCRGGGAPVRDRRSRATTSLPERSRQADSVADLVRMAARLGLLQGA
jgi:hypothetical protein